MDKLTPQEIENAKQMIVNLKVAKTMDRKTNTRRLPKVEISSLHKNVFGVKRVFYFDKKHMRISEEEFIKAYTQYKTGEVYWIREPVQITHFDDILQQYDYQYASDGQNVYQADIPKKYKGHNNPKWMKNLYRVPNGCIKSMARTFIKIANVRVERLQDITLDDIKREGLIHSDLLLKNGVTIENQLRRAWINLWNSTAPKGYKWEDNPYVFVYEIEKAEK